MGAEEQWGMGFGMLVLILGTIILVVFMWQMFATYRARAALTRETEYKKLIGQATMAEKRSVAEQERTATELVEVKERLASIERLLKEVE